MRSLRGRRVWLVAGGLALVVLALLLLRGRRAEARYVTAPVDRGDVAEVVGATGTLQAVTTVQVGSQVSGTIQSLHADFNSIVKRGQVLVRLDPSLFQARLGQAQANLVAARANVERARTAVEDTRQKYERAKELAAQQLLPQSDLDTARANYESAVAQLKAAQAAATQAQAGVHQAQVDIGHTVITSPIDGIVIGRNVDVGQTVAASLQAPVLFVIANDLSRMQVKASIDEADVGRVRTGQEVTFRVDSYPEQIFSGRVEQVRLQPTTVQNVVTYDAIIAVENPGLRLMPGMTATVSIVVSKRDDVLRMPAAALRFRPEGLAPGRPDAVPSGASATGPGGRSRGQGGPGDARAGDGPRLGGRQRTAAAAGNEPGRSWQGRGARGDEDGDGPGARPALIYVADAEGKPRPQRVEVGLSDGQFVEVRGGVREGDRVVVGLEGEGAGGVPAVRASAAANPFTPQRPQRRQR